VRYLTSLFLAALFWSTSFPLIKVVLRDVNPLDLLFWRFAFAFIFLIPIFFLKGKKNSLSIFKILLKPRLILLGIINALGFFLQFEAQRLTLAYKTAFFVNLYVVFVAIVGFFRGERLSLKEKAGILFALTGVLLLSTEGNLGVLKEGKTIGDLLAISSAVTWSIYIILSKKLVESVKTIDLVAGVLGWTWLSSAPLFVLKGGDLPSLISFAELAYLGVFCSIVPYLLFTYALKGISATRSSLILLVEVILATLWSYIFLDERLKFSGAFGALLILLGLFLGSIKGETPEFHPD